MKLNLTTISLPDLRMDGWMDGNLEIFSTYLQIKIFHD